MLLLLLPLFLLSSGCSSFKKLMPLEIRTVEVERSIPIQNRPRPMKLSDIHFYVVTEDSLDAFKARFVKQNADLVFIALSIRGYEGLAVSMAELRRYILAQKALILYYEGAIAPRPKNKKEKKK